MNKILIGVAVGIAADLIIRKLEKKHAFDKLHNQVNRYTAKTKKKVKNAIAAGKNEAEYMTERANFAMKKSKHHREMAAAHK